MRHMLRVVVEVEPLDDSIISTWVC